MQTLLYCCLPWPQASSGCLPEPKISVATLRAPGLAAMRDASASFCLRVSLASLACVYMLCGALSPCAFALRTISDLAQVRFYTAPAPVLPAGLRSPQHVGRDALWRKLVPRNQRRGYRDRGPHCERPLLDVQYAFSATTAQGVPCAAAQAAGRPQGWVLMRLGWAL